MLGLGSPVRPSVSLSVTWGEAHCTHLPLFPQDGLRVMASYFQLPPHPSRLLPVRKERHLGHTEAKAELSGIQTAWGLSLSQHRPPASHTSAETGWNHQAGRARCRRPVGGKCLPPRLGFLISLLHTLSRALRENQSQGHTWERDLSPPLHSSDPPEVHG